MSFIDRLRSELEAKERARREREIQETSRLQTQQELAQRAELQAKKFHEEQRAKAEKMFEDSGIGNSLRELSHLIHGQVKDLYIPNNGSRVAQVRWDIVQIGHEYQHGYREEEWDVFSSKAFDVVCNPEGTMVFKAAIFFGSTIPETKWRGNRKALDRAMEIAYRNPKKVTYQGEHRSIPPGEYAG